MKKLTLAVFVFFFCFKGNTQNLERVKSTLDSLCSPLYGGRGYVDGGDKRAAEFIARQYESIGLKSVTSDGYFQQFNFPINTFPGEVYLSLNGKALQLGKDFIVSAGSRSVGGKATICLLDTLIFSDSTALKKFLKQKINNSILVYRQKDLSRISKLASKYLQKFNAFDQYIELHESKLTASVSPMQDDEPTFQVLKEFFPEGAKNAVFKIEAKYIQNYTSQNVIGIIEGSKVKDSVIMVTAHYDHLGKMGSIYFPGANDNASGVSLLLEFAHYFKQNPSKYTLMFVAFAGEEAGLLGSHYYVENPVLPLKNIKFLLNLDMVGTGDDGITVVNGSVHEKEFNLLASINEQYNYLPLIKKRGEAANSDHYFFHKRGVKSFFVYALGGTKAYHDINDTAASLPLTRYKEIFVLLTDFFKKI